MNSAVQSVKTPPDESSVFQLLRADIIGAKLAPGQKLKVEELRQYYGTSGSPLREALCRLAAEGLVELHERRGFRVAPANRNDLAELVRTRQWIEQLAARESLANGDVEWEAGVVLAHRRLVNAPAELSADGRKDPVWTAAHREFHKSLLTACRSRLLLNFASHLFDSAERYRELAATIPGRDDQLEHQEIMEAALDRDSERICALIAAHIEETANSIMPFLES